MSFTNSIFRNSTFFFVLLLLTAFWGFWLTYFAQVVRPISGFDHLHGIAMFGWIVLLIVQATLIRKSRRSVHRKVGKISYVLAPWIAISTIMLANARLNETGATEVQVYVLGLQIFILAQFIIFYSMAMKNRKTPDVHARWMICTALPMIDPIFARVLGFNLQLLPLDMSLQTATYALTDIILLVLVVRDWQVHKRRDVFLPALGIILLLQAPTFTLVQTPAWNSFAVWFMSLPLS